MRDDGSAGAALVLPGSVMRRASWVEVAVRLALAGLLSAAALDGEPVVQLIIATAVAYHGLAALRQLAPLRPGLASLTLNRAGFTLRLLGRDRVVPWSQVNTILVQTPNYAMGTRAGVVVTLADDKGPIGLVLIPSIFAPEPAALAAEMERWRGG